MNDLSKYNDAINYLETSPMFNLSLSSKELFHSNFLYWLYNLNRELFKDLIQSLGVDTNIWGDNWIVKREYLNFDLSVKDGKKLFLVIENKVKSIPTQEQLIKYNEKIEKKHKSENVDKILLSLTPPINNESGWLWKDYNGIASFLERVIEEYVENYKVDIYTQRIISDYASFVKNLSIIVNVWNEKDKADNAKFLLDYSIKEQGDREDKETNANNDKENNLYQQARNLRIHDLYGKYRTSSLKAELAKRLDKLKDKFNYSIKDGAIKFGNLEITPHDAYTNSQPILEIKIEGIGDAGDKNNNIEPEAFFISIQGNQYRHAINTRCIASDNKEKRKSDSKKRIEEQGEKWNWFMNSKIHPNNNNSSCFESASTILNKSSQRNDICSYSGYGGVYYIYQYKNIKSDATIEDVLNAMIVDVETIIGKLNEAK